MIEIRVIKGSRVALALALILLAAALAVLLLRWRGGGTGTERTPASPAFAQAMTGGGETASPLIGVVRATAVPTGEDAPRVLIYHTHTREAYRQTEDDPYIQTEPFRTADAEHSVVRVGKALATALTERGFSVTHDVTDHELPDLAGAYERALETLQSYPEPFDLYLDVHRDAYAPGMPPCVEVNGVRMAALTFLAGRGEGEEDRPDFEANYACALRLRAYINEAYPGICGEVLVRAGRYNQHVGTPSLLVEVGHNENTLAEALRTAQALAEGVGRLIREGA